MSKYRGGLPQLSGGCFLADAGIETDLIFNHGIQIREFAAHTLLVEPSGREAIANYFRPFLKLARAKGVGFVLDSQTWKAHLHWAESLGAGESDLRQANRDAIRFIAELRDEFVANEKPVVLNALIGPRADAYATDHGIQAGESERYHSRQIAWLAETEVDMVTATTFNHADEAIGVVRAGAAVGLPVVVSFTVETDGRLPTGQALGQAIEAVDAATDHGAAYFMVNCAHPDHFFNILDDSAWGRRVHGIRCNASRRSHAELDASESLDDGDPVELGRQYRALRARMPWLNVFGGCCGTDLRHVTEIANALWPDGASAIGQ